MFCFHGDLKNVGRSGDRESGYQTLRYPDIRAEIRNVIKNFLLRVRKCRYSRQTGSRNLKIVGRIGKQGGRVLEIIRVPGYPDKTPGLYVFSLSLSFRVGTRVVD